MMLLPYGERGLLVEVADSAHALALAATLAGALSRSAPAAEVVPGARTVLVRAAQPAGLDALRAAVLDAAAVEPGPAAPAAGQVDLPVRYDGADLSSVAAELGIGVTELVRRHVAAKYTVAFCGFAPGFAYLTGLDPRLHAGRLAEPRTSVPAGSVGIAGQFTGVYPRPSPGGWRLLGTTSARLWDSARVEPALLVPGMTVRFVAT